MKKFFFSLDVVLNYKEQALENVKAEHARILGKVRECERQIEQLEQEHDDWVIEFEERKRQGITISRIKAYEHSLEWIQQSIKEKYDALERLKVIEEAKRQEVVEAKKETASINMLKDKKREEYNKQDSKEQELLIEEFVSNQRVAQHM